MTRVAAPPPTVKASRDTALENVFDAVRAGDIPKAQRLAVHARANGIEHPILLNLVALDHEQHGRFDEALANLRRAHFLAPKDFSILNACGLCLARMERHAEARQCFDQVIALNPDFGPGWFNLAAALERLGEKAAAAEAYGKAAALNPENVQAWANLAFLAARRGDAEETRRNAERALALQPGHPTASLALADVEMAQPEKAERRLRMLLDQPLGHFDEALAFGQLGDALDALDRPAEAFEAYAQSNAIFRREVSDRYERPGMRELPETLAWLTDWAAGLSAARWRGGRAPATSGGGERAHIFLVGFPRSGTTLAETALTNHPDVVSLEERFTLETGAMRFLVDRRGVRALETASDFVLAPSREDYWARVRQYGVDPTDKIFIDKNPFNTLKLPLIYKLFPNAKVIFCLRDPRDVVLSCFRRRFNINGSTFEFLDLQSAAENYDATMRLADILREKQDLPEHALVYERMVEDFSGTLRKACEFIGADWRDDLLDVAARGRRGDVASASSAQIARGLFTDGVGQWRRYRDQMKPVAGLLAPWVRRYGYPED